MPNVLRSCGKDTIRALKTAPDTASSNVKAGEAAAVAATMAGALCHPAPLAPYRTRYGSGCRSSGSDTLEICRISPRQSYSIELRKSTCRPISCRAAVSQTNDVEAATEVIKSAVKHGVKGGEVAGAIEAVVLENDGRITKEVEEFLHAVGKDRLEKVTHLQLPRINDSSLRKRRNNAERYAL